jgi:hypothetical protein
VPLHTTLTLASPMLLACSYSRHDVRTILYTPEGADVSSGKKGGRRTVSQIGWAEEKKDLVFGRCYCFRYFMPSNSHSHLRTVYENICKTKIVSKNNLFHNHHNSGQYLSSCLLFKTNLNSIGLSVRHRKHITSLLREPNRLMLSMGL